MESHQIIRLYFELVHVIEELDFFEKYPTRAYLRKAIDEEDTLKGKVLIMLSDSLLQSHITPNWLRERAKIDDDPLAYFLNTTIRLQTTL